MPIARKRARARSQLGRGRNDRFKQLIQSLPDQGNTVAQMMSKVTSGAQAPLRPVRTPVTANPATASPEIRAVQAAEEMRESVSSVTRQALAASVATTQAVVNSAKSIVLDAVKQISENFAKAPGAAPGKPADGSSE